MSKKILYWTPRILTILAIIFMLMFSFDALEGNESFARKFGGFLIHNIPAFILTGILIIAWIRELIGGLLFIIAFLAASIFFKTFSGNPGSLIIILPFMLTGILFILYYFLYKKNPGNENIMLF
jgi:hypothetical protein